MLTHTASGRMAKALEGVGCQTSQELKDAAAKEPGSTTNEYVVIHGVGLYQSKFISTTACGRGRSKLCYVE